MAKHISALKKYQRDEKLRLVNRMNRVKMKNRIKKLLKMLNSKELEQAKTFFPTVISSIDHTIRKGTIHLNTGSRYKSRLTQRVRKAGIQI